ncbi:MAG: SixA phosphatase family protein [Spirochaetota bacterium]
MLRLSLLRLAKSSWEHDNLTDHERPLKERGLHDTRLMAAELKKRSLLPDAIACSTSRRTRETIRIFLDETGLSDSIVVYDRALYHAWATGILEYVNNHGNGSHLMIVGHNPGIHEFVEHMSDSRIEKFPTCAFAMLTIDTDKWSNVKYDNAELTEYLYPSMFR